MIPKIREWLIRCFTLVLVLAAFGGASVGNQIVIRVAEGSESEGESVEFCEATHSRRESSRPKHRERNRKIVEHQAQPNFRRIVRVTSDNEHSALRETVWATPASPRSPPVIS